MADLVCNIAKGRVAKLVRRVQTNDPANSAIIVVALVVSGDQDDAIRDADTLAAVEALANVAEATNVDYARKVLTDADFAAGDYDPDDTNNRTDVGDVLADITFVGPDAGDNWTDLLICYDSDTTAGTDSNIIPLVLLDCVVTPDGNNITIQWNAAGFFRAS